MFTNFDNYDRVYITKNHIVPLIQFRETGKVFGRKL